MTSLELKTPWFYARFRDLRMFVASEACLFQKVLEKAGGRLLQEVHDPLIAADLWHIQGPLSFFFKRRFPAFNDV